MARSPRLAFSPDGYTLAAVAESGDVTVWDVDTRSLRFETGPVSAANGLHPGVAFSADGTMLITAGHLGVNPWDAVTGTRLDRIAIASASDLALSADGTLAAFAGHWSSAYGAEVWNVVDHKRVVAVGNDVEADEYAVALSPDGRIARGGWLRPVRPPLGRRHR